MSKKQLLLLTTVILLVVTIFWAIALYQHIQAYHRMFPDENGVLTPFGLRQSITVWGNGPILSVIGFILAFAWIVIINEWWSVLEEKRVKMQHSKDRESHFATED